MSGSITSFDVVPTGTPASDITIRPKRGRGRPQLGARYDSAQTTDENRNHWSMADFLSANSSNTAAVRERLRSRSRYERANNGYAKGLIRARTNDTIGTGPRLQLEFPEEDPDFQRPIDAESAADLARKVERLWCEWAEAVSLNDKLRVLADAEDTDGNGWGRFVSNPALAAVQLDLQVFEDDRVTAPVGDVDPQRLDGIQIDDRGNPVAYHILRQHPGDLIFRAGDLWAGDWTPAAQVIHLYDQDRPEQVRGIPLLTPALALYSILRRYTLAELGAAEVGAMIAGVIENPNALPDDSGDDAPEFEAMDQIPFARNALLNLAGGQTAKSFDTSNPNPNAREFKADVLTECGRSAGENRNTATGSSAEYNYSSGRLDHLPRQRGIEIRRKRYECRCLDRIFAAWVEEARLIAGYLPAGLPDPETWEWRWQWDGFPSIDPFKDAKAVEVMKANGLTTDADELARQGKDWREHYRQLAREKAMREELGLEKPPPMPPMLGAPPPPTEEEDEEEEDDMEEDGEEEDEEVTADG